MSLQSSASIRLLVISLTFTLGSVVACWSDKPGTGSKAAPPPASPSAVGGLGLEKVPANTDTSIREIDSYVLNQSLIDRWSAAKKGLDSATVAHPEIVKRLKAAGTPSGIGEMGKRLEAEPELESVLKRSSINGHDYMLTTIALMQAIHGVQLKQTGKLATMKVPPAIMQNIDYVGAHMPQVMAAMAAPRRPMRPMPALPSVPR